VVFADNGTTGSPSTIWTAWNGNYVTFPVSTTTSATTCGNDTSWIRWNSLWTAGTTSAATITTNETTINADLLAWSGWNRLYAPTILVRSAPPKPLPETAEQRQARELKYATHQRVAVEAERQRKEKEVEAKAKAEKLLVEHLSAARRDQLIKLGYFDVEVAGKVYRIKRGYAGNVELLDAAKQKGVERLCIHPTEHVPDADAMLGQKLLLEANEDEFRRIANKTKLS